MIHMPIALKLLKRSKVIFLNELLKSLLHDFERETVTDSWLSKKVISMTLLVIVYA